MINIIKQIDYLDRKNKAKKAWAKAYDRLEKEETKQLIKENEKQKA